MRSSIRLQTTVAWAVKVRVGSRVTPSILGLALKRSPSLPKLKPDGGGGTGGTRRHGEPSPIGFALRQGDNLAVLLSPLLHTVEYTLGFVRGCDYDHVVSVKQRRNLGVWLINLEGLWEI
eukprot:Hpha_TRINITY_DN23214_c0_g1::TRINITY_DN23214_c0_g1_i1::g.30261::m.30261